MRPYPAPTFPNSHAALDAAVTVLSGEDAVRLEHGDVERRARECGEELTRCLIQDHMDLRSEREKAAMAPMRGSDGELRTELRPSSRPLGTLFGTVLVRRLALVRNGVSGGLRPLDAHLNLPTGKYSHGVLRELAWGVAQASYDATLDNLRRMTGTTIAKRQAEELVVNAARDFEDFYLDRPVQVERSEDLLVVTFDGCGVVMRPEALRPATRKKAASTGRKRSVAETAATGCQKNERKHRKRMAEVAAVYSLEPVSRTPDDVLRELRRSGPHKPRPKAKNKRVWASLERPILDVVDEAFYEALQRDESRQRRWVAVVDGNAEQIRSIERMAHNAGVVITLVIDFIHVLGYLWKAGKALKGKDVSLVEAWVSERSGRILRGEPSQVAAGMRRSATLRKLGKKRREAVDECANYLLNHKAYLRYHEYLRDGLPIASGVIEGACRSVVRDRMDITGARWGLPGAEAVLRLRSLRASGDLDDYLTYHAGCELERNHLCKYDERELRDLRDAA